MNKILEADIPRLLTHMAQDLRTCLALHERNNAVMIGIHTGGVWVAEQLHRLLDLPDALGHMSIAFYRDDFSSIGLHPHVVTPSVLPFDVSGRHVILVDDVLHTGRTVRAALNELFDYGRPASVMLAVLVERGTARELPVCADVVGLRLALKCHTQIKLSGPHPLQLEIHTPT
jgi:pyrimidine operon attenuation protein / uracil phosphoribosyltransferase